MEQTVYTHCRICMCICGLKVTVDPEANRVLRVEPDKENPFTWRDFCAKGSTGPELIEHPRRITAPMKRVGDRYVEASWEEAIADIAGRLKRIIERDSADAVGFYCGNPAGFTFSNMMFFGAFMDAIGTGNRYWFGSIDENTYHVVSEEMYGWPMMSLTLDIDECQCFLIVGGNPAESTLTWVDSTPNGWRRVLDRQKQGADVILVDPRRTASADHADTHVAIRPGTDWAFLLGLVKVIFDRGWEHREDCAGFNGTDELRRLAAEAALPDLAQRCGVPVAQIEDVARRFATAKTAMCLTHTGVAHNTTGTMGEWLGHALNAITGRLDRPGGRRYERGLFDITKMFKGSAAAARHRSRLRGLPAVLGYHAVAELADEITTPGKGQIRAMILDAGNPVISGPDGEALDAALAQLDLLVAIDLVQRESHRHAHWLLPAPHWLERQELWVSGFSLAEKPYVQYGRRAVRPPAGVREEWEIFTELALAMDRPLFGKRGVNGFIRASRWLARVSGRPGLAFNPGWIERLMVRIGGRVKWRDILARPHGWIYAEKEYGRMPEALLTPDQRVHVAPPVFLSELRRLLAQTAAAPSAEYRWQLINRRRRNSMNSWLNDLPGLNSKRRGNQLEVSPEDASALGLREGDIASLSSPLAGVELPVTISDRVRPGVVCAEHGWGSRVFDPKNGGAPEVHGVNRNLLVNNRDIDPLSQIPAFNSTWVRVAPARATQLDDTAV